MKYIYTVSKIYAVEADSKQEASAIMTDYNKSEQYLIGETMEFDGIE